MAYRFPRWISYALLGLIVAMAGLGIYAAMTPAPGSRAASSIVFGLVGVGLLALLLWGYLYVSRYVIALGTDNVAITGAFRTRLIPLGSIAQVITVSSPRGGTDSWLLNKEDVRLAKIDGGLVGFDVLLANLGEKLRPYQVLFYRSGTMGAWEMQVAGDSKWVPSEAPNLVRATNRRLMVILAVGGVLIAAALTAVVWN